MKYWIVLQRTAWTLFAAILIFVPIFIFSPKIGKMREDQRKKAAWEDQNRRLEAAAAELKTKRERFLSDPDFLEKTARESGMVRPDETVFKFTNEHAQVSAKTAN